MLPNGRKIVVQHIRASIAGSNCIANSFTGDGSTTAFTLTQNPASENNTQVFLDGVYQLKNSYAVSGTTLTFDAAPANSTAIEVMMFTSTDLNTLPASFVSGLTEVTAVGADHMMIFDATDSALKKSLVSDVIEQAAGITSSADATAITIDSSENVAVTGNLSAAKLTSNNGVLELDDNGTHNGIINVPASISINIDSDNGATTESFSIAKDKTGINDTDVLFRVQEDGKVGNYYKSFK